MAQGPAWIINHFPVSKEIPRLLWKPNVYFRVNKGRQQSQMNLVHNFLSYLFQIHFNTFVFLHLPLGFQLRLLLTYIFHGAEYYLESWLSFSL